MATPSPAPSPAKAQRPASKDVPAATPDKQPASVHRFGNVSAAVFIDHIKTGSGPTKTVMNVSLRRSYRDADGVWKQTHTLQAADLLPAALALTKCYEAIADAKLRDDERE